MPQIKKRERGEEGRQVLYVLYLFTLFYRILAIIGQRWTEAEHLSTILQAGRHKEDIANAVLDAQGHTESRLRHEFDNSLAALRNTLAAEHHQELKKVEAQNHEKIDDMQKRILAIFSDAAHSNASR